MKKAKCENCSKKHDSNYGSGRFCCAKCARGFSTKDSRDSINAKVSEKLKGRILSRDHCKSISIANLIRDPSVNKAIGSTLKDHYIDINNRILRSETTKRSMTKSVRMKISAGVKASIKTRTHHGWLVRRGKESIGEALTREWLTRHKIRFIQEYDVGRGIQLDFAVFFKRRWIDLEIDGRLHVDRVLKDQQRDIIVSSAGYTIKRISVRGLKSPLQIHRLEAALASIFK